MRVGKKVVKIVKERAGKMRSKTYTELKERRQGEKRYREIELKQR